MFALIETIKPILEGMIATRKDFMKAFKEWDVEEFEPKVSEKVIFRISLTRQRRCNFC